ncbi:acyltransferase [Williamsia sterculiae]|uniref:Peptidoglycan/LPS O-acetylase OafA/YrhL, contains acyltransferase and SGNH-hydrolase domains n=1 Tax=Williamsia sterculiae TaxID=1344003 RepID=A0A1N7CJ49_9NOCA|nr:acyltransferase [Williamsia sterculiae]SIR63619.1 Peptidoglycan/LPS O-acetylase OafA/YrhL, contains acyltransferase and SGNH-hydrolase domains [Williamsia sterculiae]
MTTTVEAPARTTPAAASARGRLYQADFIRGTTFALVIFSHVLSSTTDENLNVTSNALGMWGHVSRNAFFFLTGFVLMYANMDKKDFHALTFWPRRLKLVVIPYVIWSFVYWAYRFYTEGRFLQIPTSLTDFWNDLKWGVAAPHLYFIFVMMQVYVLFPALLWLVRRTRRHHVALVATSFVLQVALVAAFTHYTPGGWLGQYWWRNYATFLPYQFFIVLGAVIAMNRDRIDRVLRGRGRWVATAIVVTGALAYTAFILRTQHGITPLAASDSMHPSLLPYLVCAIVGLYALAVFWARHRDTTPRIAAVIRYTADRSFSIFLVHVLVLQVLLHATGGSEGAGSPLVRTLHAPWATAVIYLMTIAGTLLTVEVLRRLPGSRYITGKERLPLPRVTPPSIPRLRRPRRRDAQSSALGDEAALTTTGR